MRQPHRRLWMALLLSLAVHAACALSPGWALPERAQLAGSPVIVASLVSDSIAQTVPSANPTNRAREIRGGPGVAQAVLMPIEPQLKDPPDPQSEPLAEPQTPHAPELKAGVEPEPTEADPPKANQPEPAPAAQVPGAPAPARDTPAGLADTQPSFPRDVKLVFAVTRGEGGLLLGRSVHTWHADQARYRVAGVTTSAGLVALFKTLKMQQTSEGRVKPEGLVPSAYRSERDGATTEEAVFDWEAGLVRMHSQSNPREAALPAGTQDVLSLFYHIALTWRGDETIALNVATGKSLNAYRLQYLGDERLSTRLGGVRAAHIRRVSEPGQDAIEFWLARDWSLLPVRIRFVDRKGEVYDQVLEDFEINGSRPAPPKGQVASDPAAAAR